LTGVYADLTIHVGLGGIEVDQILLHELYLSIVAEAWGSAASIASMVRPLSPSGVAPFLPGDVGETPTDYRRSLA
jgi:hypothetical protein